MRYSPRLPAKHKLRHLPCGFPDLDPHLARGGAGVIPYQLGHDSKDSDFSLYIAYVTAARQALEDPAVDRSGSPAFRRIEELVQACRDWASMHVRPVPRTARGYTGCTTTTPLLPPEVLPVHTVVVAHILPIGVTAFAPFTSCQSVCSVSSCLD